MTTGPYGCERAGAQHTDELLALFEGAENGCYCNYWHFTGDKNAWLERCFLKPEENRAALVARLHDPELCGVVARREGAALCGWLKVTRAASVKRLYDQRVYRNLPCFGADAASRDDVYAVGCLYVAPSERGRGVAKALLRGAIDVARAAGASALEAFPRGLAEGAERPRADEVWMGPQSLFLSEGFAAVSDFRPYPVLRLHLR